MLTLEKKRARLRSLKNIADLLDTRFSGPFGFKFGLDPLIGLIPVLGDLITFFLAAYLFIQSIQFGIPVIVLLRMLLNTLFDQLLKWIPVLGVVLDFAWKSNVRNIRLIERYVENPSPTYTSSWGVVAGVFAIFVSVVVFVIYAGVWITLWLARSIAPLLGL
jgi:Domain of unknown function (DUF4112)